jgi:hypothetical protein
MRLDNELGAPLGEAAAPLTPEAWEALRALLTEHRRLTERLAREKLFAAAGRPATGSETARRELDRAWRETPGRSGSSTSSASTAWATTADAF